MFVCCIVTMIDFVPIKSLTSSLLKVVRQIGVLKLLNVHTKKMESENVYNRWNQIQKTLSKKVINENDKSLKSISKVGGLDISFHKIDESIVCVTLVVLNYDNLNVVYEDSQILKVTTPYKPGFLGFREVPLFKKCIDKLRENMTLFPEVFLVDGNGRFHCNRFGSASHIGVECDIATIGVAKNLYVMSYEGILRDDRHKEKVEKLYEKGDNFLIKTAAPSSETLAVALRTSNNSKQPVYISIGHKCDLSTAVEIVNKCSKMRIPEPVRQADMRSREVLRKKFPDVYLNSGPKTRSTTLK